MEETIERKYSYMIIKPDSGKFFQEISEIIENSGFERILYYAIDDWEKVIKEIYYLHYKKKGEKFANKFQAFLDGLMYFYDNYAIAIVLCNLGSYEDLTEKVFNLKMKIRAQFINPNIAIATNRPLDEDSNNGDYLRIIDRKGNIIEPRCLKTYGKHFLSDMNVIHCPDSDVETTLKELEILYKNGVFSDKNLIIEEMKRKIAKYGTMTFIRDMDDSDYVPLQTPNLSGFMRSEIDKYIQRYNERE